MGRAQTPIQKSDKRKRSSTANGKYPAVNEALEELAIILKNDSPFPLYRQVADQIGDWIESGRLKAGWPLVSERTMSEMLNLSRRTVRAALQDLIERHYISVTHGCGNFVMEPPRKREARILALECFGKEPTGLAPVYHDLIHEAEKRFNTVVHYKYVPTVENFREILKAPPSGYHGILLYRPPQEWMDDLVRRRSEILSHFPLPLLVSNRELAGSGFHFVSPSHSGQTHAATRKLVEMGHRRIGYISGMVSLDYMRSALQGYKAALKEAHLSNQKDDQLFMESLDSQKNERLIQQFLEDRHFTAVVVAGGAFSSPFENAVQRVAVHIPSELSAILITEKAMLDTLALRWSAYLYPDEVVARSLEVLASIIAAPSGKVFEELVPHHEVSGATCKAV